MKKFTITITGECDDDVPDEYIEYMAGTAEVQVLEPLVNLDGDAALALIESGACGSYTNLPHGTPMCEVEFDTRNVDSKVAINTFVRPFLDLSTAHLPQEAIEHLKTDEQSTVYENRDYGIFVHVFGEEGDEFPDWYPPELVKVVEYARTLGVDYVLFDRDGLIDEHLPTWEW